MPAHVLETDFHKKNFSHDPDTLQKLSVPIRKRKVSIGKFLCLLEIPDFLCSTYLILLMVKLFLTDHKTGAFLKLDINLQRNE